MLSGVTVVINAGPTYEPIDPVRFIGNRSSGKMGFALAQAAAEVGAKVYLIAGPVSLSAPACVERVDVQTAQQMLAAVQACLVNESIFIGAGAVADYRPAKFAEQKIKKTQDTLSMTLIKNPDIIQIVAQQQICRLVVGFAAESERVIEHAKAKLHAKQLDMIIANDIGQRDYGFESDDNHVTLISRSAQEDIGPDSKYAIAKQLIQRISQAYEAQCPSQNS
jgi:phosphopantothenoylcysteine decarboxylase/phosphopantothenate--cysteine ligase